MLTKDIRETYGKLSEDVKAPILALSVLIARIGSLPRADRDDLFELLQGWCKTDDPEEHARIQRAMEEILAQDPVTAREMPLADPDPMPRGLKGWARHVGQTIRTLRERSGLTQVELAKKAGLPQSHISRLENAEHSATHLTLEKIAGALGVPVGDIDPCVE
jgi:DNA-binding XRE family transcriptional regulator